MYYTNYSLKQCYVPVVRGGCVKNLKELEVIYNKTRKPIVIKPTSEM